MERGVLKRVKSLYILIKKTRLSMKFKHESGLSLIYKNKDVIFILRKITFEKFSLYTL